jgi:hypothetical protein
MRAKGAPVNVTRLLALDPSSTAIGWAILLFGGNITGDPVVGSVGTHIPDGTADWVARLDDYGTWLDAVLKDRASSLRGVAYEVATGNRGNMRTNRILGAVEYVTIARCRDYWLETVPVTASQTKARVRQFTAERLCRATEKGREYSEHVIDAVAVGLAAIQKVAW